MTPSWLWHRDKVTAWEDATVHINSETALRGTNVFEGLVTSWDEATGTHRIVALAEHLERLRSSAEGLYIPYRWSEQYWLRAIEQLLVKLNFRCDCYLRPSVFVERGDRIETSESFTSVSIYPLSESAPLRAPSPAIISGYERLSDAVLSARIKSGGGFLPFRLPRNEHFDVATGTLPQVILLNRDGLVAEALGASVFAVRDGNLLTPGLEQGLLEGVTRRIVMEVLAPDVSVEVREVALSPADLIGADEVFLTGTLAGIQPISMVDEHPIGGRDVGPVTSRVGRGYEGLLTGRHQKSEDWMTFVAM